MRRSSASSCPKKSSLLTRNAPILRRSGTRLNHRKIIVISRVETRLSPGFQFLADVCIWPFAIATFYSTNILFWVSATVHIRTSNAKLTGKFGAQRKICPIAAPCYGASRRPVFSLWSFAPFTILPKLRSLARFSAKLAVANSFSRINLW
jgi:hypothetical protein